MARVIVVRDTACTMTQGDLAKALGYYYPGEVDFLDPVQDLGEDLERRNTAKPIQRAWIWADIAKALHPGARVYVALTHGTVVFDHRNHRADVAVVDVAGENTWGFIFLPDGNGAVGFILERSAEILYKREIADYAGALAEAIAEIDPANNPGKMPKH